MPKGNGRDMLAAKMATSRREKALNLKQDFAFETVLSRDRNLIFLKKAKEKDMKLI
jgi:predicted ABC-type ATPase